MPWTANEMGDREYVPSAYVKEDLPTWSEIYDEWYQHAMYDFNPACDGHIQPMDHYWKIPHRKFLLAVVCNQLNKRIFEDGFQEPLLDHIQEEIPDAIDVRFSIHSVMDDWEAGMNRMLIGCPRYMPPIYTLTHPDGKANPFINPKYPRIMLDDCTGKLELCPMIYADASEDRGRLYVLTHATDPEHFTDIMAFMFKDIKEYFEGDHVGWKEGQ